MTNDSLILIFTRNAFYRRLYHLALAAFALSIIVIAILVTTLILVFKYDSQTFYFATDDVGRLIKIVPLDRPNMSDQELVAWVVESVQSALSFDYINYREELQNAEKYFTRYGWSQYMEKLTLSNNLLAVTKRRMIARAQVVEPPKMLVRGLLAHAYAWKFQMPVLVTYSEPPYDGSKDFSNALQVTVIVQRQSILQSYKGLGIVQLIGELAMAPEGQGQQISATSTS